MSAIDDLFSKEPEQRYVEFCLDRDLRDALSEAQQNLTVARAEATSIRPTDKERFEDANRRIADLEEIVADLVEQARPKLIRIDFGALDPQEFDDLKGEHRPTSQQLSKARQEKAPQPEWNNDTFEPALVAAACIKVTGPSGTADGMSLETAEQMWTSRSYNEAERSWIFNTALSATMMRTRIDIPKGG